MEKADKAKMTLGEKYGLRAKVRVLPRNSLPKSFLSPGRRLQNGKPARECPILKTSGSFHASLMSVLIPFLTAGKGST